MSVQYTAIFHGCKNDNLQMTFVDIFLIFAQNIDCEYTLEPPQSMFYSIKMGCKGCTLHRHISMMYKIQYGTVNNNPLNGRRD